MGLIKAATGAAASAFSDAWRDYFYSESLPADILVTKGWKRVNKKRSSNTKADANIISNGSLIAVNEGQFMIIVDQGQVVEFSGEPGEFLYDASAQPSMFYGKFSENLKKTFEVVGKRIAFGGDTGKDQRIYFFNMKEIMGNKYGTPSPVPFRVVDKNIGLDIDIAVACHGEYSYKITDPLLFFKNVCGNVQEDYNREKIDLQLKSELMTALQPAFAQISSMGIRYSAIPGHTMELAKALNDVLSEKWSQTRGIEVASFGVSSIKASAEDEKLIKDLQRKAVLRDPTMAAASIADAQSEAMVGAANNENTGAFMAFAGMNMAQNAGGMQSKDLFAMGAQQEQQKSAPAEKAAGWDCKCGAKGNRGKFCVECGKPQPPKGWTCSCGAVNKGKFCSECGKPKPPDQPIYRCDKCGWEPEPGTNPKFCPECGDVFDENDIKK